MSDGLRSDENALGSGSRSFTSPHRNFSQGWRGTSSGVWPRGEVSKRPALEQLHPLSRILPWRRGLRRWCKSPDWLDRTHCQAPATNGRIRRAISIERIGLGSPGTLGDIDLERWDQD